jgi:hypothetical protein
MIVFFSVRCIINTDHVVGGRHTIQMTRSCVHAFNKFKNKMSVSITTNLRGLRLSKMLYIQLVYSERRNYYVQNNTKYSDLVK